MDKYRLEAEDFDVRTTARLALIINAGWVCDPKDPELIDFQYERLVNS